MAALRLATASLLAVLYTGAALVPCPGAGPTLGGGAAHEPQAVGTPHAHHGHAEPEEGGHATRMEPEHGLHQATLAAPCSCGCGERDSTPAHGGRLDPALASRATPPAPFGGAFEGTDALLGQPRSVVLDGPRIPI